jgi:hypothetical protein
VGDMLCGSVLKVAASRGKLADVGRQPAAQAAHLRRFHLPQHAARGMVCPHGLGTMPKNFQRHLVIQMQPVWHVLLRPDQRNLQGRPAVIFA